MEAWRGRTSLDPRSPALGWMGDRGRDKWEEEDKEEKEEKEEKNRHRCHSLPPSVAAAGV